jgi:hypothetical protein
MPNTCQNCQYYNTTTGSMRTEPVGECRARPPVTNYAFPKVRAVEWCGEWQAKGSMEKPFLLDTQTASGAALPPPARLVAEGSSAGTRPRRTTTAPAVAANAPAAPGAL